MRLVTLNMWGMRPDWPFRGIDHVLVRCGPPGPTLVIESCRRVFDQRQTTPSDHYGLLADVEPPATAQARQPA